MKYKKQKGLTATSLVLTMAFLGIGGIYGMQIALGFLDQNSIRGAAKAALIEAKGNDSTNSRAIKTSLMRKLSVNDVNVNDDDVTVLRSDNIHGGYEIDVSHTKKIKISSRVSIVMDLDVVETTEH